jgi:hypothetical protein
LTFEVVALPNMGPLTVRLTGPDGSKKFVRRIIASVEAIVLAIMA